MISVQGGPFVITIVVFMLLGCGFAIAHFVSVALLWRGSGAAANGVVNEMLAESRRLLSIDEKAVSEFVHGFGQEVFDCFDGETWLRDLTLHDLRAIVESAVFELVRGCACGECAGRAGPDQFYVEARFHEKGISLNGIIARQVIGVDIDCEIKRDRVDSKHESITMVCEACKETPVMTSIGHISAGKKPICAPCAAGGARA